MAGSHKNGIQASRKHLFENAVYILIPTNHHMEKELDKVKTILQPTNSHFIVLKPKEHDEMTSVISHFPHLIASSLVHQAKKWEDKHAFLPELAAGGFRDITRIASSNPKMWEDIFYHNRGQMIHLLDEWIQEMKRMKDILKEEAKSKMIHYLKQAKDYRDGLESSKRGALPSYYDLHVDIEDRPGALLAVLQILAEAKISLTNVQILEIREGLTGVLRLSVATKEAQEKSYQLLTEHNYFVTIKE